MSHSLSRIWVHAVFGTKHREQCIISEVKNTIYQTITKQLEEMKCELLVMNGMPDHIHLLFLLNPNIALSDVMQKVKGVSSHEINAKQLTENVFSWQVGYGAFSVSLSKLKTVKNYIINQEKHHSNQSFEEEYEYFLKNHTVRN